ncbi:PD-(D/E)XK nuclease-like domain-containing protein [Rhizobium sp. VS19-DR104.2]|uniref:PD-(D/E)XK nuclease-like domain-containing protein n=1 Tax=unclassified Rhizobium TaxID=2613769 RepID=UPI001CC40186|nr:MULTISPECIES: PD-(D/E)XK nuclease-like domain-containing protein [unclassified Rhizobium]MBZ5761536.1 PD-(D/E)XK nuclease-like domain-containing protein [Rhizobium sp. VS19-DR96]MBZ5767484.1 PD-(D/E)XK nuclease-like domain-containing protein [Rhizobium sp. VS19-DR129.2]MBZ5775067.1 PD-(D/E)XK nuclease-like domain-containing protein [Rhizobium sp. VS19-DRK62.2]MBZ5785968.1 PD-(D/E)XK nuclease-like domain-containing protein [Rhizobium sp. VS19-DR121]MBZ5803394.1 PD-(D/E)XK nuclease-like domai
MNAHVDEPEVVEEAVSKIHEDGIWFSLSDEDYHADPALGSTGLKKLVDSAPDFWWGSSMNEYREEQNDDTPAKVFGRQLHQCVLEGVEKFKTHHSPTYFPGNRKEGIKEIAEIKAASKVPVKFKDYGRILAASAFMKANSFLRNAFEGGQPEVSVFWTVDGIRYKARFDYLKMNAISDLKSIRSKTDKPFKMLCMDAVGSYDYLVSAEHYSEGRRQMTRLIKQGAVFNAPDTDGFMSWLIQVAGNKNFAFVFVFWKAEGSPISKGFSLSPDNPCFEIARKRIDRAVANYKKYMEEFGPDTAWVLDEPLEEIDPTDLPAFYHHRIAQGA